MALLMTGSGHNIGVEDYPKAEKRPVGLTSSSAKRGLTGQYPCIGMYWTPKENPNPEVAFMLAHYSSDFSENYLAGPLAQRGYGVLGYSTRFRGMEERFILEKALDDIAAGTKWLKEVAGVKHLYFIGNSGGGSLMAAFQQRAESDPNTYGAEAFVFLNAHPGRADVLTDVLDPSVVDELDPTKTDPSLDMYNPVNGPPYSEEFQQRYRAAQRKRNDRITHWAQEELARLNAAGIKDRVFGVSRVFADLRTLDPAIDPSKRKIGVCFYGDPQEANRDVGLLARACTLSTWLSMWSLEASQSRFELMAASFTIPTFVLQTWGDMAVFPSYAKRIHDSCGSRVKELRFIEGEHFFEDNLDLIEDCADVIVEWIAKNASTKGL